MIFSIILILLRLLFCIYLLSSCIIKAHFHFFLFTHSECCSVSVSPFNCQNNLGFYCCHIVNTYMYMCMDEDFYIVNSQIWISVGNYALYIVFLTNYQSQEFFIVFELLCIININKWKLINFILPVFKIVLFLWIFCLHVCEYTTYVPGFQWGQKGSSGTGFRDC